MRNAHSFIRIKKKLIFKGIFASLKRRLNLKWRISQIGYPKIQRLDDFGRSQKLEQAVDKHKGSNFEDLFIN